MKKVSLVVFAMWLNIAAAVSLTILAGNLTADIREEACSNMLIALQNSYYELEYNDDLRTDEPAMLKIQNQYDVQNYRLELSFDIPNKKILGTMSMDAQNLSDTLNSVYINLEAGMKVSSVKLNNEPASYEHKDDYIIIRSKGMVSKFTNFNVAVNYEGTPENKGFDSFSFKTFDNYPAIYTLSEPTYAPTWWPCKDIVTDKFAIDLLITVPEPLTAASNGVLVAETPNSDSTRTFHWKSSYPISTYLVSLAIAKYDKWTEEYTSLDGSKTMPVEYYTYPSYTDRAKKDWANTLEMMQFFSALFGEYPFIDEKYGMAMFGWVSGAMEHQTLSSMGYTLVTGTRVYEAVTVHELVHQWYGDAVSPESWKDIWLNEGFASYGEALWEEHKGGKDALSDYMVSEDYGFFTGTLYEPEGFIFGPTTYQKGSWALHMLRGVVGDTVFFDILSEYYEKYKYKNANTFQFKEVCERVSGRDLTYFFDQWIFKGTDRPEYEISWKADTFDGQSGSGAYMLRINLEQKQKKWEVYKMPVRVTVKTDKGEQELTFFNDRKKQQFEHPVNGKPISVTLDKDNWILKSVQEVKYKDKY